MVKNSRFRQLKHDKAFNIIMLMYNGELRSMHSSFPASSGCLLRTAEKLLRALGLRYVLPHIMLQLGLVGASVRMCDLACAMISRVKDHSWRSGSSLLAACQCLASA